MRVTPAEVGRIAALARLRLSADEAAAMAEDLSTILDHVDALQEVAGDEDGNGSQVGAPQRPDEEGADPLAGSLDALAPEWRDGFFLVPRLESHGSTPAGDAEASAG